MKKSELIEMISQSTDLSKESVTTCVDELVTAMTDTLGQGDTIIFPGFGTFSTTIRSARQGRNLQTGEALTIAEATVVKFKAGKQLKERVNT